MKKNLLYEKHLGVRGGLLCIPFFMLTCMLLLPLNALADEGWGPGQDSWKFELGGYFPSTKTQLQVNGIDLGDDIDIEDTLGFSDSDAIFRLDGYWRFFKKHRLGFGYYQFNRDGSIVLEEDIEIGDTIFNAGSEVSSELNLGFYTIDYIYSFYQGEKWEISAFLGAHWIDVEFSAAAYLQVNDEPILDAVESTDFNGPLPHLGLAFEYYITPKWLAIAKGSYFQLDINDIDGKLTNLGAKLEYQFTKTFGLGIGYDYFRIDVTARDKELSTDIVYNYHGLQAYGILRF